MYNSIPTDNHSDEGSDLTSIFEYNPRQRRVTLVLNVAIVVTVTAFIAGSFYVNYPNPSKLSNFKKASGSIARSDNSLSITVSNEYGAATSDKYPYPFLADSLFAETYKQNLFSINGGKDECSYVYDITSESSSESSGVTTVNDGFYFHPKSTGSYSLSLQEICDGAITQTLSQNVWSKYVRREISSLTEDDREEFLDAFATLWKVSTVEGRQLYGDAYKGLYHFALIHNDAGASVACDEFHGDAGFLSNHVMLGAYLEQSLRLVNPKTSLHYLEYSTYFSGDNFDSHFYNQLDGGSWVNFLTSAYFGSNDPVTGRILDGRWENTTVPYLNPDFYVREDIDENSVIFSADNDMSKWYQIMTASHMSSPYGLMRAPWNYNPSPYLTRYNNINLVESLETVNDDVLTYYRGVSCDDYSKFTKQMVDQTMATYLLGVEDSTHGNFHFTVAGAGGDFANSQNDILRSKYGFDDNDIVNLAKASQTFFKYYVTIGIVNKVESIDEYNALPIYCTGVTPVTSDSGEITYPNPGDSNGPSCYVNPALSSSDDGLNSVMNNYFRNWQDDNPEMVTRDKITSLSYEDKLEVVNMLVGRFLFDGDMAGSGAAIDPLFWVAHGAVDRLFQKVMLSNWLSDSDYPLVSEFNKRCSGHIYNGTKPWLDGYQFVDPSYTATEITNNEFLNVLNPLSDQHRDMLDSVYDHSNWLSMCSMDGIKLFKSK